MRGDCPRDRVDPVGLPSEERAAQRVDLNCNVKKEKCSSRSIPNVSERR